MTMFTRSRIILLLLFILAFGAGWTVGKLVEHRPQPPHHGPSWLSGELNLTPEQRKTMMDIWNSVNQSRYDEWDRRRELGRQRTEAIRQLVPQESQALLEQINENYNQQLGELSAQRRQRFEEAMEKTRAVLSDQQRKKYEEILARREGERRRGTGRPERSERTERDRGPEREASARDEQVPSQRAAVGGESQSPQPDSPAGAAEDQPLDPPMP